MATKTRQKPKPPLDTATLESCLAKAVAQGDFVAFRQIFGPVSPLRAWTPERLDDPKYAYFRPTAEDQATPWYRLAKDLVAQPGMLAHAQKQLEKDGPPQLSSELLLALADNAVRLEKFGSAAQAYELLRIRGRMQETFLEEGDAALETGDLDRAVRAYRIGVGLAYDYTAFPEPLPAVPAYQTRALMLHADYPTRPENCVALQAPDDFLRSAANYLLQMPDIAARLDERPLAQRADFLVRYIRTIDPDWNTFVQRYQATCTLVKEFGERMQQRTGNTNGGSTSLADEAAAAEQEAESHRIPEMLLGRTLEGGQWWQYLKELALAHPASVLFVARQHIGHDVEIIKPLMRQDSPLAAPLGLAFNG